MNQATSPAAVDTPAVVESLVKPYEAKYRFNKDDMGNKRNPVELVFKVPTVHGIYEMLVAEDQYDEDATEEEKAAGNVKTDKVRALIEEALADVVNSQVKAWVGDNADASQATFDKVAAKFLFEAIAQMDKKDRRSSGIPKELWEAFAKKYQEIMPGVTKIPAESIKNHTIVYLKKFSIIKTEKDTIRKLLPQLALFVEHADKESVEQFSEIIELLETKAKEYLESDEVKNLVANLGI